METESNLSLSEWFPWQNRLQPTFIMDHSKQTKNFVELVEFLELQEALDPNEDNYGQEMEVFLNEADILKPGQIEEESSNIRHFFVSNDNNNKQGKKKRSLLKTRRSDQLPEFEPFVLSGDSDDDLPAVFDKKESIINDADISKNKDDAIGTKITKALCKDKTEKKFKPKKRNSSGNTSVIEVITDTDVHDFVDSVTELTVINEESQGPEQDEGEPEQKNSDMNDMKSNCLNEHSLIETNLLNSKSEIDIDNQIDEECQDFTKLLPTFFAVPSDQQQQDSKTNDSICYVPEAPSLDDIDVLVESISHMTTLPNLDLTKLVVKWEKENIAVLNKAVDQKNHMDSDNFNDSKCYNQTSNSNFFRHDIDTEFDKSSECSGSGDNSVRLQKEKTFIDNVFNISSDFESPNKPNGTTSSNVIDQIKNHGNSGNVKNNKISSETPTKNKEDNVSSNVNSDTIPTEDIAVLGHSENENEMDIFSESDEFMDTQANFMLTNDDLLADFNSDECKEETQNTSNDDKTNITPHNLNNKSNDNKKDIVQNELNVGSNDNKKDVVHQQHELNIKSNDKTSNELIDKSKLRTTADDSLFGDSFMNTSLLEAVKTQTVATGVKSPSPCCVDRNPSPSQFTFTQALACVQDSDSLDKLLDRNGPIDDKSADDVRTQSCDKFSRVSSVSDEMDNFTVIKHHKNTNIMDTSQVDLINNLVNMENSDDFSDDEPVTELPLFDLGFDVDDDIIPPSPCLSQNISQKSAIKSLSQSLLSRKSLSFSCDKSKLSEDKSKSVVHSGLPPMEEALEEIEYENISSVENKVQGSQGFETQNNHLHTFTDNANNVSLAAVENKEIQKENKQIDDEHLDPFQSEGSFNTYNITNLSEDFDMMPTSPVLSGKRPSNQKSVNLQHKEQSPVTSVSKSPVIDHDLSALDSPCLDDSFVVRKKRRKAVIIDSPVTPVGCSQDDFDDFKTPLRPIGSRNKDKSTNDSEEKSVLKRKKSNKSVSFVIKEFNNDLEDDLSVHKNNNVLPVTKQDLNRRSFDSKKGDNKNKTRKSKSPANPFLVDEAEVSEDEAVSSDEEEGSDLEHMEDSFVADGCTQLSQGQHEELQAFYLKSVRSPAGQGGKFKLQYDYDDNIDVYSQVPQDEESQYYEDSFVVDEVEENSLLDGHEITILDKGNIIDNDSFVGPRTRWSKPTRSTKVSKTMQKVKRRRVKRISDSSSEDESGNLLIPRESPAASVCQKNVDTVSVQRSRCRLISSSDDESDKNQESPDVTCSLKSRITNKQNPLSKTSKEIVCPSDPNVSFMTEREDRIQRQKEKQEEFIRNMAAKHRRESLFKGNCNTSELQINNSAAVVPLETSQLSDDCDLLLNTSKQTISKSVIIIDSREINGAQDIVSELRFKHNLNVVAAQLDSCDYVVSIRMGVDRKQWSEFSNGSNRAKLTDRVQEMCNFYERPCLIIEKDKMKGEDKNRILHWTKYVDKSLVQLLQSKITLFFTDSQSETASLLADLCQLEHRKNCAISCQINLNTEQQNWMKFLRSIPHLSYVHCLFLCNKYVNVRSFLHSDIKTIMINGKMTEERAADVYNYIQRMFDSQMLPSSYG